MAIQCGQQEFTRLRIAALRLSVAADKWIKNCMEFKLSKQFSLRRLFFLDNFGAKQLGSIDYITRPGRCRKEEEQ